VKVPCGRSLASSSSPSARSKRRTAVTVSVSRSTVRSMDSGSTPGRSKFTNTWSPWRTASIAMDDVAWRATWFA
jgi:hypothetical protein